MCTRPVGECLGCCLQQLVVEAVEESWDQIANYFLFDGRAVLIPSILFCRPFPSQNLSRPDSGENLPASPQGLGGECVWEWRGRRGAGP